MSICHFNASLKTGQKQYSYEEFLAIYKQTKAVKEWGTFRDFEEAFKSFDREGQGFISAAEMRHLLTAMGQYSVLNVKVKSSLDYPDLSNYSIQSMKVEKS